MTIKISGIQLQLKYLKFRNQAFNDNEISGIQNPIIQ